MSSTKPSSLADEQSNLIPSITHVLFDVDGLLLDTESVYTTCIREFVAQFGKAFPHSVKEKMMGRDAREAGLQLINSLQLPCTIEEYLQAKSAWHPKYLPSCQLMPGAERLVKHLAKCNIPMCLASGSSQETFAYKTQRHQALIELFSHVVLSTDTELRHSKPSGDIFTLAASRFHPPPKRPEDCLVFEDSPNGIDAGLAADMRIVAVPHPLTDLSRYANSPRVKILTSLEHFDPQEYGLPAFAQ